MATSAVDAFLLSRGVPVLGAAPDIRPVMPVKYDRLAKSESAFGEQLRTSTALPSQAATKDVSRMSDVFICPVRVQVLTICCLFYFIFATGSKQA